MVVTMLAMAVMIVNGNPAIAYDDASSSVNGHLVEKKWREN